MRPSWVSWRPSKPWDSDVQTGIAVMNLAEIPVRLTLELVGDDGEVVATAEVILTAMGQLSAFVDDPVKFPWDQPVDFADFEGTLRAWADGGVAATVVQTRPDQFATQPVAPNGLQIPGRELLLPFRNTGDLMALDEECECVLRFTKEGEVSIEISRAEILAVTNRQEVDFDNEGIVFDTQGLAVFHRIGLRIRSEAVRAAASSSRSPQKSQFSERWASRPRRLISTAWSLGPMVFSTLPMTRTRTKRF